MKKYVLVHCTHGHNRTGFMIINYLLRSHPGMTVTEVCNSDSFVEMINNWLFSDILFHLHLVPSFYFHSVLVREYNYLPRQGLLESISRITLMNYISFIMRGNLNRWFVLPHPNGKDPLNLISMVKPCKKKMMMAMLFQCLMYVFLMTCQSPLFVVGCLVVASMAMYC